MTVHTIHDRLVANPVSIQLPIGAEKDFRGIIDLIDMRAIFYQEEKLGASFEETEIPAELAKKAAKWRSKMIEAVAEENEELMDAFVHDRPIDADKLRKVIREAVLQARIHPVFCGTALKYIGVQRLLDGVVDYLPSPLDRPVITGHKLDRKKTEVSVKCDPKKPLVAIAFKITSDQHGDLNFLRIYQGTLKSGSRVLNANRDVKENVTRIFEMHANSRKLKDSASAGDIVAVVGLKGTLTGDTICDPKHPVILESITFPETVMNMSIEPRTAPERPKLAEALAILRREDPTFGCKVDPETGQTIISGMGELHLEILEHKLIKDMKVNVRVGKPKVAYKEAISRVAEGEGKFVRQTGGRGQYGHVVLKIEPSFDENGHYAKEIEFENQASGSNVPREYVSAVERGAKDSLASGALAGYPVVGVKVTLIDGSYHSVDSSELAFEQAATLAINNIMEKAGPVLLEPIMLVQAVVPEANYGAVQGTLIAKRGVITGTRLHGNMRVIDAKVPLASMFGYSSEIRSVTAGRGSFVMEPMTYERVPDQICEKITSGYY
jgi:elongation factor G